MIQVSESGCETCRTQHWRRRLACAGSPSDGHLAQWDNRHRWTITQIPLLFFKIDVVTASTAALLCPFHVQQDIALS